MVRAGREQPGEDSGELMLVQTAPAWLIVVLCVLLFVAAAEDVVRLKISNVTALAVMVAAGIAAALAGIVLALWQNVLVFLLLLGGGTMLFAAGKVGGGDVKLLAAVGLWMDLEQAVRLLVAVLLSGGILAIAFIGLRLLFHRPHGLTRSMGVPYAVAIAAGATIVIMLDRKQPPQRPNPMEFWQLPTVQANTEQVQTS